jgi:hypothetical protein
MFPKKTVERKLSLENWQIRQSHSQIKVRQKFSIISNFKKFRHSKHPNFIFWRVNIRALFSGWVLCITISAQLFPNTAPHPTLRFCDGELQITNISFLSSKRVVPPRTHTFSFCIFNKIKAFPLSSEAGTRCVLEKVCAGAGWWIPACIWFLLRRALGDEKLKCINQKWVYLGAQQEPRARGATMNRTCPAAFSSTPRPFGFGSPWTSAHWNSSSTGRHQGAAHDREPASHKLWYGIEIWNSQPV